MAPLRNAAGGMLGLDGLMEMLKKQGYPTADIQMETLEEDLLKYSNGIRLADDLTLIEIRIDATCMTTSRLDLAACLLRPIRSNVLSG